MDDRILSLFNLIPKDKELFDAIDEAQRLDKHLNITGLCEQQKGFMIASLADLKAKKPVVIVSDVARARLLAGFLKPFVKGEVITVVPREMSLVSAIASSKDPEIERLGAISRLLNNDFGAALICSGSLLNKMPRKRDIKDLCNTVKVGDSLDPSEFSKTLIACGYERVGLVEAPGEFSWRGDVIDICSPDKPNPIRIGFFDDEVDQIKYFDLDSQRSTEQLKKVTIMPAREIIITDERRVAVIKAINGSASEDVKKMKGEAKNVASTNLLRLAESDTEVIREGRRLAGIEKWISAVLPEYDNILDYVDLKRCTLFVDELFEIRSRADSYMAEYMSRCKAAFETGTCGRMAFDSAIPIPEMMKAIDSHGGLYSLSCLNSSGNGLPGGRTIVCHGMAGDSYRGSESHLAEILKSNSKAKERSEDHKTIILMVTGKQRTQNLVTALAGDGASIDVIEEDLPSGFVYPKIGLMLIGEQDVFGAEKTIKKKKKGTAINLFSDLVPGDYVVHDAHGIGRYEGLVNMKVGDSVQDYLKITYAKGETLYITVDNLDAIQKYIGPNGSNPKLSSLHTAEWTKSVERAKNSIKRVAFDLVKLYAIRRANKGFACGPDDVWQTEFEENFPYVETDDQLAAIKDIKRDMESEIPMDRLLCGDVGFGKTEVAFRAIYKCVQNGRQAFMLSPTTLLAQQHYDNFKQRIGDSPLKVVLLSRYVPAPVMKQALKDIKDGVADVVIGTHRILSDDVKPCKLGLLVVDEEQRFGVNHKEKIKAMRNNVDVLTLSATPIPRTLHMSMAGIRDISVLDDAPMNRRPVQTYVMSYDKEVIVQACMREIARHGQVFYLYNKTADIDKKADELSALMPGVKVLYAHGKMSESRMESIITSFVKGEADILVCTTIIESGVDMPNVNTMIVEDGDRFGLSQLYQIKGRVGRSDKQAYAYITYREDKEINSDAKKRLMAIREFTELGSGIKIALRDLEVRGAGNLLGAEQHGQMDVIGYELYCRLLDEEIKILRDGGDESLDITSTASVELDFDSYIPGDYIEDESSRMIAYRRISAIMDNKDYDDFMDEILDRYGEPPREIIVLMTVSLIRSLATRLGFEKVVVKEDKVLFYYSSDKKIDMKAISVLLSTPEFDGKILLNAGGKPYLHFMPIGIKSKDVLPKCRELLTILSEASEKDKK
ncbi:MAG: transcription-repair coupling factor [Clostridia bacterium]|nr:transcription-repair coupling factor [Clostridia bacterium]